MIEINNKHIVLIFIIIIIGIFIYNFDVYVISKNQPLCKPIYVTKREISPEIRAELNKEESGVLKDTFSNLIKSNYLEGFNNVSDESNIQNESNNMNKFDVPPKSFSSFTIVSITNKDKLKVIDSVIKILSYIPTNYCESQIKQLVEYFGLIYENSPDLETFYKNVSSSTKIKEDPYNSKYSHLILFLIGKFDHDYSISNGSTNTNTNANSQYTMSELIAKIMENNQSISQNKKPNQTESFNESESSNITKSPNQKSYLESEINTLVDNNKLMPNEVINVLSKSQPNNINSEKILPRTQTNSQSENNYLDEQIPYYQPNQPNQPNQSNQNSLSQSQNQSKTQSNTKNYNEMSNTSNSSNSNGTKCTYKCDSSYMNAIKYLDGELKPLEGFGNIGSGYAPF
jgi:hypothetical protein